jgi:hypothetical protein
MSDTVVPIERITSRILLVRGRKVLLDRDLAEFYGVETKALNRAVKRNLERFPDDFMFQLSGVEAEILRCQSGTSSSAHGGRRYLPYVFTEQGVAMLSGLLSSPRAVAVNIGIMRAFVQLREFIASNAELARKLATLEKKYDAQFKVIFDAIRSLMDDKASVPPSREIGYHTALPGLAAKPAKKKPAPAKAAA